MDPPRRDGPQTCTPPDALNPATRQPLSVLLQGCRISFKPAGLLIIILSAPRSWGFPETRFVDATGETYAHILEDVMVGKFASGLEERGQGTDSYANLLPPCVLYMVAIEGVPMCG